MYLIQRIFLLFYWTRRFDTMTQRKYSNRNEQNGSGIQIEPIIRSHRFRNYIKGFVLTQTRNVTYIVCTADNNNWFPEKTSIHHKNLFNVRTQFI